MSEKPSEELIQLLQQLRLANGSDVLAVARHARRLARGLPLFDSVWVDALVQARLLSPLQAAEIKAGRGLRLQVGPYVLAEPLDSPAYARLFRARQASSDASVQLLVADLPSGEGPPLAKKLKSLVDRSGRLEHPVLVTIRGGGLHQSGDATQLWCACDDPPGIPARRWLVPHGRMPHQAVLHIAQQMTAAMVELERHELPHADVSTTNLWLNEEGQIRLRMPGIRSLLRPEEGYAHAQLPPEAFDYLAPERVVHGSPPDTASELYACGALWWHLLAGRPPVPGGDSLAKLRNVQKGTLPPIRQIAPETPEFFAEAITQCTHQDPRQRAGSFEQLAARLGPPLPQGAAEVADCIHRHFHPPRLPHHRSAPSGHRWTAAMAGTALAATLLLGLFWYLRLPGTAPIAHVPPPRAASPEGALPSPPAAAAKPAAAKPAHVATTDATPAWEPNVILLTPAAAAAGRLPKLSAGITVRGDPDNRPVFQVPPEGILLDLPHLRFENIDFVWNHPGTTAETPPAMIRMTSRWIEFHQCSFQSGRVPFGSLRPVAVACRPADRAPGAVDLPAASHVVLDRSVFRDVEAAIASATAVTLQSNGSLYLGPGPVLDLANWPTGKQPVRLALSQCTLRNATALVWVRGGQVPRRPQAIVINAESSVFAPRADGALLFFETLHDPHDLLSRVQWTGHSSLLSADATLVAGSSAEGEAQRLDESQVAIEGLARSHCEFAGPQIDLPAASRLEHWSVPLRASATPGIDPGILQLPHVPTQ